jgi:hypothetical protein
VGTVAVGHRVVVFLQENKTTDFYFPTMAAGGLRWRTTGSC